MYLTTQQIKDLLADLNVAIFDDGISSVDLGYGKYDGRAYSYIHNQHIFGDQFDISHNLHIGDNKYADVIKAKFAGSSAILWHQPRLRRFRTRFGALQVHHINHQMVKNDSRRYKELLAKRSTSPNQIWQKFGTLFSQPLYTFIMHIGIAAKNCPGTTFLMVSSEAKEFYRKGKHIFPSLFDAPNIVVADKLNRRCVFRAYAYLLATSPNLDYNAESIFSALNMGEMEGQRRELYEFFFGSDYEYSEMNINTQSKKDFRQAFINNIRHAKPRQLATLRESYEYVRKFYPRDDNSELVITDVGWGGTIQAVLREIIRLDGQRNKITGLYIGTHAADFCKTRPLRYVSYLMNNVFSKKYQPMWNAVIWEYAYTNKTQYPSDQAHLEQIAIGFQRGEKLFRSIAGNPLYTFAKVTSPQLRRLVSHPTRKEAETIGNIYFDFKFVDEDFMPLINTNWTTLSFWRLFIKHPRNTLRNIIFRQNVWSAAYFKYYHLDILKPAIWLWGKIRHRSYM